MPDTKELKTTSLKVAKVKAHATVYTAVLSLVGVVFIGYMQFGKAKESSINSINDKIRTHLIKVEDDSEERDNKLEDKLTKLGERLAKIEGRLEEILRYMSRRPHSRRPTTVPASLPSVELSSDVEAVPEHPLETFMKKATKEVKDNQRFVIPKVQSIVEE